MGCAMSTKYLWCKDLPTTHKDSLGNRYCVFHAPVGKKKVQSAEAFNRLVFERVTEENTHGRACDLSGAVFEGRIDPKGFLTENPRSVICFANTTFPEDLDLSGVKFTVEADFQMATFSGAVDFRSAVFCSRANFDGATFMKGADFSEAEFKGAAHFFDATFLEMALFKSVKFDAEIYFSIGSFKDGANFTNTKYGGTAVFKRPLAGLPQGS